MDLEAYMDALEDLEGLDDESLMRALRLVLDPPVSIVYLGDSIRGGALLPQPKLEYVEGEVVKRVLGEKGLEVFIALDLVVSLMPYSAKLYYTRVESVPLEEVRRLASDVRRRLEFLERLKSHSLMGEDEVKREVMLLAPSKRLVEAVKGRWDEWVWRRIDRYGVEAPDADRLVGEVLAIADALRGEGVKATILVDGESGYPSSVNEFNVVPLRIPASLAKLVYVRDQSVTWLENPIVGNMALDFRRGEEDVIIEAYHRLGFKPIFRVRWSILNGNLVKAYMEGGNFFVVKTEAGVAILTGVGVRGSNYATFKSLAGILPEDVRLIGVPLAGYVRDWASGAVHLDVVFSYIGSVGGERLALVDPSRMGFYALLEYDRRRESFKLVELPMLAREMGFKVDEPPREGQSPITMVNALNLGRGKIISDASNELVNRYLEMVYGVDVIRVDIPQLEAGGGGVRCATRELWRS